MNWPRSCKPARGRAQPQVLFTCLWLWFLGKRKTSLEVDTKTRFPYVEGESKQGSQAGGTHLGLGLAIEKRGRMGAELSPSPGSAPGPRVCWGCGSQQGLILVPVAWDRRHDWQGLRCG